MTSRSLGGLPLIMVATAIAGLGGYAISAIAARGLGPEQYSTFALFWSLLYLVIGALAGFQQEMSRAARPGTQVSGFRSFRHFVIGSTLLVGLAGGLAALAAMLLVPLVDPGLLWAFVVGITLDVPVAVCIGLLYGLRAWWPLAIVLVGDVALRFASVVVVIALGGGAVEAAWATALPLVLVFGYAAFALARRYHSTLTFDAPVRTIALNVVRTVGGSIGIAVLVSGFPLFLGVSSPGVPAHELGTLVFALMLTRAPLVVGVIALQSYLVVRFRGAAASRRRTLLQLAGGLVVIGAVLALLGAVWGPDVIVLLAGVEYAVSAGTVAALVLASIATSVLAVTGAAVLGQGLHSWYVVGWTAAAVVAVIALFAVPLEVTPRLVTALVIGPLVGIAAHTYALLRVTTARPQFEEMPPQP